jgi:hypothetical protein
MTNTERKVPERVRRVLELRSSGAASAIPSKKVRKQRTRSARKSAAIRAGW